MATAHYSSPPLKTIFVGLVLLLCSVAVESSLDRKGYRIIVVKANDEFRVSVYLGSKKFKIDGLLLSTSYNFAFLFCYPCTNCYPSGQIFNPITDSSSYHKDNCFDDKYCTTLPQHGCDENNNCMFSIGYHMSGFMSNDKLRFASFKRNCFLKEFHFGCVHHYNGPPDDVNRPKGVLGLSRNSHSLVSQFGVSKFSYCLPVSRQTGWVDFGNEVDSPGHLAVTTAFVDDISSEYHIQINSLTVLNQPTIFINQQHKTFLVNTGIQMTYVDNDTMHGLITSFRKAIPYPALKSMDPALASNSLYNHCFNIPPGNTTWLPSMRMDFHDGGSIFLYSRHFLQRIDENTMCLTIFSVDHIGSGGRLTFGSDLAKGREIVHDLESNKMSFSTYGRC